MTIIDTIEIYKGVCAFPNYDLNIVINLKTYGDQTKFYYIDYTWFKKKNGNHPFEHDIDFRNNHMDGEIIAKNELTDKLVEFLIMSDYELDKVCGSIDAVVYRQQIIKSITLFWD